MLPGGSVTRSARSSNDWGIVRPRILAVVSRVEDWRGTSRPVSSPRHLKPGVPISGTGLSWSLRVMGYETYWPGALSGTHQVPHSVICKQPERGVEPCRTPPLPAKAPTIPRPHQMTPNPALDPQPHNGKAPARMPDPKVVHPAPQLRIDRADQSLHWLRPVAPELLLELPQQGRARSPLRHVLRPPAPPQRADAPEVKAQESEALPPTQIHDPTLLLVQPYVEFRELLAEPPAYRLHQPVLPTVVVHEDHQVVCVTHVLHVGVRPVSRDRLGSLQHRVHLREVDVAEQGRDHAALRNPALPGGSEHQLQQVQDLSVLHPAGHLGVRQD